MEEQEEYTPDVYDQADWYAIHFPEAHEHETEDKEEDDNDQSSQSTCRRQTQGCTEHL